MITFNISTALAGELLEWTVSIFGNTFERTLSGHSSTEVQDLVERQPIYIIITL